MLTAKGAFMKPLFEDKHIIVVEKPQNLPTQRDKRGGLNLYDQVKDYLEFGCGIDDPYLGLIHRLDRHTGGLVVFAKTPNATRTLNELFASRCVIKRYIARVEGHVTEDIKGLTHQILYDSSVNVSKIVDESAIGTKTAILDYEVKRHYKLADGSLCDLCVTLHTGRKHQIRAQLAHIGHPILGDEKYGAKQSKAYGLSIALWSSELIFSAFGINYHFTSQPPNLGIWKIK